MHDASANAKGVTHLVVTYVQETAAFTSWTTFFRVGGVSELAGRCAGVDHARARMIPADDMAESPPRLGTVADSDRKSRVRWRHEVPATVSWPPSIVDGVAYFADSEGGVYAVAAATGRRLWAVEHDEFIWNEIQGPLAVADALAIVSVDECVIAHDRTSGRSRWRIEDAGDFPVVIADMLVTRRDDVVSGWDLASRDLRWRTPELQGLLATVPARAGDFLFYCSVFEPNHIHGGLRPVDTRTGTVPWEIIDVGELPCSLGESCEDTVMPAPLPAVPDGDLLWYAQRRDHAMGDLRHELIARDLATGAVRVEHAASWLDASDHISGAMALDGGLIFCPAFGRLDAVDAGTGSLQWTHWAVASIVGAPVVVAGVVHIATEDGQVHGLDAASGALSWSVAVSDTAGWLAIDAADDPPAPTPFVHADGVFYISAGSEIVALGR